MSLRPCPACARHVRLEEAVCPFCGEGTPADFAARRPGSSDVALTRAALLFAGAAAVAVAGCPSEPVAAYGPAPVMSVVPAPADAGSPTVTTNAADASPAAADAWQPTMVPAYGVAPVLSPKPH